MTPTNGKRVNRLPALDAPPTTHASLPAAPSSTPSSPAPMDPGVQMALIQQQMQVQMQQHQQEMARIQASMPSLAFMSGMLQQAMACVQFSPDLLHTIATTPGAQLIVKESLRVTSEEKS